MRSITKTLYERLQAQATEAGKLGLKKTAENVNDQVCIYNGITRDDSEFYRYSSDELTDDLQKTFWDAAVRVADYLGASNLDAQETQKMIEKLSSEFFNQICVQSGKLDGVGIYEEPVPGEKTDYVTIDLEDEG